MSMSDASKSEPRPDHGSGESSAGRTVFIPEGKNYKVLVTSRLMVAKGPDLDRELVVEKERVTIGRMPVCDLVLDDGAVSGMHAELVTVEKGRLVRDLGSKNGLYFKGHRVNELFLQPGTIFQIGNDHLRFDPLEKQHKIPFSKRTHFGKAIGKSIKMREIFAVLEKVAPSDLTVLLCGETGTGKELLASAIHAYSFRKDRPFVVFDCGAVSPDLIESTLFGHVKGAFTGAEDSRKGVFEEANGGTLFFDELGELSVDLQPKLLRVLESGEIQKVGSIETKSVDVRIVAATNRNLHSLVEKNAFRQDLLYRLSVCEVEIPPLRERSEDIAFLAEHFVLEGNKVREELGMHPVQFESEVLEILVSHSWPGNVRELSNVIERTMFLVEGDTIGRQDLQLDPFDSDEQPLLTAGLLEPYKKAKARLLERFERQYLSKLLQAHDGNLTRAAKHAGLVRHHLRDLCRKYGIPCGQSG